MAGTTSSEDDGRGFVRELGFLDSVMIVAGSAISSGIFWRKGSSPGS